MSKDRISRLCEYIDKNKAKNYPIHNSILSTETDYIKNSYFKMLAVILEQGQEICDSQRTLFERQIAGVDCDYQAADYFRQALEIEIEEYVDFAAQCKETVLRYRFILDAVILTAVDQFAEEQLKLVANFAEDMKLNKKEVEYISLLAKSILEQNMEYYSLAEKSRPKQIPCTLFEEYLVYTSGIVCNSEEEFIVHGAEQFKMTLDQTYGNITQNKVIFKNLEIDMKNFPLNFSGCEKVELIECVFIGGKCSISFKCCKEIRILNCEFRDFKTRAIIENENINCSILQCKFINCKYYYYRGRSDWEELGGVIYTEDADRNGKIFIRNSEFKNCGGVNSTNYYSSAIISNCNCEVHNCSFYSCWNYSGSTVDPETNNRSLFNSSVTGSNNEFVDSANFKRG